MEVLATCESHAFSMRSHLIGLWGEIFHNSTSPPNAVLAIRHRFLFELKKKIAENLDPDNWYYPVVARLLVSMWGIPNCDCVLPELVGDRYSTEERSLYKDVFSLYRINYVAIYERDSEFARKLLPKGVDYVENPHRLTQLWFRGKATTFSLLPPTS